MVLAKCVKCFKGFRGTREGEETTCAKCVVAAAPIPKNGERVDAEFRRFVDDIYGIMEDDKLLALFNASDVFNHKTRLLSLKQQIDGISSTKERARKSREVNRILEEHDALQEKLASLEHKIMSVMLLQAKVKPKTKLLQTPAKALALTPSMQKQKASPKKKSKSPPPPSPVKRISVPTKNIKNAVPKSVTPPPSPPPLLDDEYDVQNEPMLDELSPLKRSNSVRNRIKAFEELSRRASTGTWDRKQQQQQHQKNFGGRRKLEF